MILVDTPVWIDHFRAGEAQLVALLNANDVLVHPCVIGDLALGALSPRAQALRHLNNLPHAIVATHAEVMAHIDAHALANSGIGYIDAHLLASCALTPNAALWTRDKALRAYATRCGVAPKQKLS